MRQHGNVGVTGGIAIGGGLTLFALIAFPPVGLVVGIVLGAILFEKLSQRRKRKQWELAQAIAIRRFYQKVDQVQMTDQWSNPGWRP